MKRFIYCLLVSFLFLPYGCCLLMAGHTFTLVIDPGHGGKDCGAPGRLTNEKTINLRVAKEFGRLVKANCSDVKVVYTRTSDVFIGLQQRADIANKAKADLFISIHTNSLSKGRVARGSETYTLGMHRAADNLDVAKRENSVIALEGDYKTRYQGFDPNRSESYVIFEFLQDKHMKASVELARCLQLGYKRKCRPDRGVRQAGFLVLRETSMPSVLTELGFISTRDEERYMHSSRGVRELAQAIYTGFCAYRKSVGKMKVVQQPINEKTLVSQQQSSTEGVIYRVQFATSSRAMSVSDRRFRGLKDVWRYKQGNLYKYTSGEFSSRSEALSHMRKVRKKYKDAFIAVFKGEKRIK